MVKVPEDFDSEIKRAIQQIPHLDSPKSRLAPSPPVFVKVERYRELLEDLQQLRSYSLGLRDALDAMSELEKEFKTAMGLTHKVLDKLNIIISSIDMKLLRRQDSEAGGESSIRPPPEIEEYVKSIYEQIDRLKTELHSLSG